MPRLIISTGSGSDPGRTVDLGTDVVSIGRDAGNTIPLDTEGKASRRHCQVAPVSGNGWEVVDNQSTNGTRVNGAPVDRRRGLRGGLRLLPRVDRGRPQG
jgi:pSer/pThr/pTyr-binding forkhead associated (FHA) protein